MENITFSVENSGEKPVQNPLKPVDNIGSTSTLWITKVLFPQVFHRHEAGESLAYSGFQIFVNIFHSPYYYYILNLKKKNRRRVNISLILIGSKVSSGNLNFRYFDFQFCLRQIWDSEEF